MGFVLLAVLFIALKAFDVAFMATVSWWWLLVPLLAAMVWWEFADKSGYTQKKAMERMDERKEVRRQRQMKALGQGEIDRRR